ncbi:MAG: bifunctional DNA-formamidopyrimidine glycosylase/DNA-(apurinic or apyrimidinic site) lyase, partial [Erysipelotrichia bacterium]|nr:bifunctional DNA-formamidopyrimidine glycosylase/DNA-(apurinic or apyrimidinic site) lyase [Erysipelotrichia bacterium]
MPELPEVETIKNVLLPIVKNRKILGVEILRKSVVYGLKEEFIEFVTGTSILNITRRGKFLIFHLSEQKVIISHLRMEGKYYELAENEALSKYARVVFHLDNQTKLCYDDLRSFGRMAMSDEASYLTSKPLIDLGPEPFDITDVNFLYKQGQKTKRPIKTSLLSQKLFVGLGNIYVDEVLFKSGLHPLTPTKYLSIDDWEMVVAHSKSILKDAIASGGTTVKSYRPGKDISGNFQTQLRIYGRRGQKCVVCHRNLRFIKVGGRGTTFCPQCQLHAHSPLKIAIVGKIAAGKSTVLDIFMQAGYC